ncbi:MAG: type II toxin-antitoxin system RelE/ParE family toxin [Polyangiales bacterium]
MGETVRALVWSNLALARLTEIRDGLAEKDPRAAMKVLRLLVDRAEQLADFPHLGRVVPEIPESGLRELVERH